MSVAERSGDRAERSGRQITVAKHSQNRSGFDIAVSK